MNSQWRIPYRHSLGRPMTCHDPKYFFYFWGSHLQTTQQYCNGHPTSATICDHVLQYSQRETSSTIHPTHHLLLSVYQQCQWCPNKNPQLDALEGDLFKSKMNKFPGLTWEFSDLSTSVDFMDMTITINKSSQIETTLFEKKLNLHLYIPPPPPPPFCPPTRAAPGDCIQHTVLNFYPLLL